MKRYMTFVMAIISIAILSVDFVLEIIGFAIMLKAVLSTLLIFTTLLFLGVFLTTLVLNACVIPVANKSHENYVKNRALLITAIGFNFFVAIWALVGVIEEFDFVLLATAIICLITGIFYIIDLVRENIRLDKSANKDKSAVVNGPKTIIIQENKEDSLQVKLEKLEKIKSKGLITDKEYDELKKSYIEKELEK